VEEEILQRVDNRLFEIFHLYTGEKTESQKSYRRDLHQKETSSEEEPTWGVDRVRLGGQT